MKKWAVLLYPQASAGDDEYRGAYGTQWHIEEAHDEAGAVEQVLANTANPVGQLSLVVEVPADGPTVVEARTSFAKPE